MDEVGDSLRKPAVSGAQAKQPATLTVAAQRLRRWLIKGAVS